MSNHFRVTTSFLPGPVLPGSSSFWMSSVLQFHWNWSPDSETVFLRPLKQIRILSPSKTAMQGTGLSQGSDPKPAFLPVSTYRLVDVGCTIAALTTDALTPVLKDFDPRRPSVGIRFTYRGLGKTYPQRERYFPICVTSGILPGLSCDGLKALKGNLHGLSKLLGKLCPSPLASP